MKRLRKILALILTVTTVTAVVSPAVPVKADSAGKYVQDVFIAYAKTEEEAKNWLTANGWEPIAGNSDFNAGKASYWDDNVVAVMGMKRTDDKDEAITDMAVMNMTGGYSLPDYEKLLEEKGSEITEFVNSFLPTIEEYRANYMGEGSTLGKARADISYEILNKFYDGTPGGPYAVNDTGEKLGDLLLNKLRQEGNASGGDLKQILMESSGAVMIAIEQLLALGADDGQDTWLERLAELTGDGLVKNITKYAPEAAGQNLASSAAMAYLKQHYEDAARLIADQWQDINREMLWYEDYTTEYDLWFGDDESEDDYDARLKAYFENLKEKSEKDYDEVYQRYMSGTILYNCLYEIPYRGAWGETLGDFFNPFDGTNYGQDADNFLTFAAAMSPGQRAALEILSLRQLLMIGFANEDGIDYVKPDLDEMFGDDFEISVYTGINRAIFRGGVALTSQAKMEENMGNGSAYDQMWNNVGTMAIITYVTAAVGVVTMIAGGVLAINGLEFVNTATEIEWDLARLMLDNAKTAMKPYTAEMLAAMQGLERSEGYLAAKEALENAEKMMKDVENTGTYQLTRMGIASRVMMGIGGALLIFAAILEGVQLYKYYQHTFTPIPLMIVDEADIVEYLVDESGKPILDEKGNQKKKINFDQYVYYEAVRCNRQEVGEISDWQDGVAEYVQAGCGDIADLNGDFGQEWIALYTVKSLKKGNPILADSLTLQYGSSEMPKGCTQPLHFFCYTNAVDLGDTAYSYNNKMNGVYFFWDAETPAPAGSTGSVFNGGHLALFGIGGLILGILGATFVLLPKRRKEELL